MDDLWAGVILLVACGFFFGFMSGLIVGHQMGLTDHASGQWICQLATKADKTTDWICTKKRQE